MPGLEEHLLAGRDRQPHAPGGGAVEAQRAVDLEEVEVRRDADRDLALVDDRRAPVAARSQLELRLAVRRRARGGRPGRAARPAGCRRRTAPRPRCRGTSAGDAVEHVVRTERARSPARLRLGVVARRRARPRTPRRQISAHGLGLVEPQPARAPLARQLGREEQQQAILLAREEAHGAAVSSRGRERCRAQAAVAQQRVALRRRRTARPPGRAGRRGPRRARCAAATRRRRRRSRRARRSSRRRRRSASRPGPRPSARAARGARCARARSAPSTGTPIFAARCSIASKTENASSHARPTGVSSGSGSGTVAR